MEDRYIELKDFAKANNTWDKTPKKMSVAESILKEFVKKARCVYDAINVIEGFTTNLMNLRKEIKDITTKDQEKRVQKMLKYITKNCKSVSAKNKKIIEFMTLESAIQQKENPEEPETRSMLMQVKAVTQKFSESMKTYQLTLTFIQDEIRNRVKRQVSNIEKNLTEEQLENISQDPDAFQDIIVAKTMGKVHLKVYYGVEDILEKYNDIKKLEKNVEYILELMNEIEILVQQQGEMLDSIESQMNDAKNYVHKAVKILEEEKKAHKKNRKKYCCILMMIVIGIGIVMWPVTSQIA